MDQITLDKLLALGNLNKTNMGENIPQKKKLKQCLLIFWGYSNPVTPARPVVSFDLQCVNSTSNRRTLCNVRVV